MFMRARGHPALPERIATTRQICPEQPMLHTRDCIAYSSTVDVESALVRILFIVASANLVWPCSVIMPRGAIAGCVQADEGRCNRASRDMADSNHVSLTGEPTGTRRVLSKAGELADKVFISGHLSPVQLCMQQAARVTTSQRRTRSTRCCFYAAVASLRWTEQGCGLAIYVLLDLLCNSTKA